MLVFLQCMHITIITVRNIELIFSSTTTRKYDYIQTPLSNALTISIYLT